MRAFLAIDLDAPVRDYAARAVVDVRRHVDALAPDAVCTWVRPAQLHLTVRFLGELGERDVVRVCEALRAPLPVPAFEMALAGIGVFPPRGRPRACWLGVDPGGDAVRRVAHAVHDRLRAAGLPEAADEFHPHVTLARVRRPGSLRAATLRLAAPAAPSPAMRVDAITLFESRLVPPPVTYVPVARVPLSA